MINLHLAIRLLGVLLALTVSVTNAQDSPPVSVGKVLEKLNELADLPASEASDSETHVFLESQQQRLRLAQEIQPSIEDQATLRQVIDHQFESLRLLVQKDYPGAMSGLWELAQSYRDDQDEVIASTAKRYTRIILLQQVRDGDRLMSPYLHQAVDSWLREEPFNFSKAEFALQSAVGLEKAERYTLAASLHDRLSGLLAKQLPSPEVEELAKTVADAKQRLSVVGQVIKIEGETISGQRLVPDDFQGKVVLIDFWASWCLPCRREMPEIRRAYERYGDQGFAVVGVCMDDHPDVALEFIRKSKHVAWPSLYSSDENQRGFSHPLAKRLRISLLPTAVLLDQNGRVLSLAARGENLDRWLVAKFDKLKHRRSDLRPAGMMMTRGENPEVPLELAPRHSDER